MSTLFDARAQTADCGKENIAKRWRIDEIRARMVRAATRTATQTRTVLYLSARLVDTTIPIPIGSSRALDFFYLLIACGLCKKRKYCYFHFFLSTLINTKPKQTQKNSFSLCILRMWWESKNRRRKNFEILILIVTAQEFSLCWHDNFYFASTIMFTVLRMVIFTVRAIFFVVLRKYYKIAVPHSNFYLEFSYNFWQIFSPCSHYFCND